MPDEYAIIELKVRARGAVLRAVQSGKLARPDTCSRCGTKPGRALDGRARIQAHHDNGYDQPLDVIWLCVRCHQVHHEKHGPGPVSVAVEGLVREL